MAHAPPSPSCYANPLPFSFFASLVEQIGSVTAKKVGQGSRGSGEASKQQRLLQAWVERVKAKHGTALPEGTVVLFFRLFFPEEGVRRRYGLQEKTLADLLESHFKVRRGRFAGWAWPSGGASSNVSGCLGEEVGRWMEKKGKGKGKGGEVTIGRLDQLLDELASSSSYSAEDVRNLRLLPSFRSRSSSAVLVNLLTSLSPFETALVIQLILRDLSPLLYPPPSSSGDVALARYNTTAYDQVSVSDAMKAWYPGMGRLYLAVADLDWVSWQAGEAIRQRRPLPAAVPQVGLPIKIPKTEKPGTCARATKCLQSEVAVETKYDGERLQIHIDLSLPYQQQVRIFSKSGRDSTQTRHLLLPIIRASLSLPLDPLSASVHPLLHQRLLASSHPISSTLAPTKLILEGEMVPYDESRSCIDEFWKLDCAKNGYEDPPTLPSAWFPSANGRRRREEESCETGETGKTPSPMFSISPAAGGKGRHGTSLHLIVVWFDVLVVGEETLLDEPYYTRRARLESLVLPIEGFSMLSDSVIIDFAHAPSALENLRLHFAHIIAKRCEGLMLKPLQSKYNDFTRGMRWVKLKKDFIPGAGDTLDFTIVSASWQKDRGRELLVPPSVYTTFFVGLLAPELGSFQTKTNKPHYHILFSASYGPSRDQLAKVCHEIREAKPERFDLDALARGQGETLFREVDRRRRRGNLPVYESACTTFTFSLAPHLRCAATRPSVVFRKPRVMELNGAGFQRTAGSPYYELRFPRITKSSRHDHCGSPLTLAQLQDTAQDAMQAAPTSAAAEIAQLWRSYSSTTVTSAGEPEEEKYRREVREWVRKLEAADGVLDGQGMRVDRLLDGVSAKADALNHKQRLVEAPPPQKARPRLPPAPMQTTSPTSSPPKKHFTMIRPTSPPSSRPRLPLVPNTPPRAASQSLARSASSPCARSDAPSPPTHVISPRKTLSALFPLSASAPELARPSLPKAPANDAPAKKRTRLSCASSSRHSSIASLSATLSTLLPLLSSSPPSTPPAGTPPLVTEFSSFSWTIFPPPSPSSDLPTPRYPHLDASNYLSSPLSVLWVAGLAPPSFSCSPYSGPPRQGFVFVAEGNEDQCVEWLVGEVEKGRARGEKGKRELVWVVKGKAVEERVSFEGDVLSVLY
ncbi:hypothetical protein JCM11641_006147 [Rhodosporidiobolus odoratus]